MFTSLILFGHYVELHCFVNMIMHLNYIICMCSYVAIFFVDNMNSSFISIVKSSLCTYESSLCTYEAEPLMIPVTIDLPISTIPFAVMALPPTVSESKDGQAWPMTKRQASLKQSACGLPSTGGRFRNWS